VEKITFYGKIQNQRVKIAFCMKREQRRKNVAKEQILKAALPGGRRFSKMCPLTKIIAVKNL
jgi:hypothetical protein